MPQRYNKKPTKTKNGAKKHHRAHRHSTRLARARRVSFPPSIPKSCFPIFPFKRVCACFPFPLFFNRSNPVFCSFLFTSFSFLIGVFLLKEKFVQQIGKFEIMREYSYSRIFDFPRIIIYYFFKSMYIYNHVNYVGKIRH